MQKYKVVVIGAGYAGLMAALRLGGRVRGVAQVTLINASDTFVERIRLHQVATGQGLRQRPIAPAAARRGVEFIHGRVERLEPSSKSLVVQTAAGPRIVVYDTLLYALGSHVDAGRVPGGREHAYVLGGGDRGASALRDRLRGLSDGAAVTVIGGGLTGIEAVSELAERFPRLSFSLTTRGMLAEGVSEGGRAHIRRVLERLGVRVHEGRGVQRIEAGAVVYDGGARLEHDVAIWAGAFGVPPLAREAGLQVNRTGQVIVDETFRSVSHPDVYAVGDCADVRPVNGIELRMSCQSSVPQGAHAAEVIAARLHGRAVAPFRFGYIAQCVSLGRRDGLVQFVRSDDSPTDRFLTGRLAAVTKELVCRFAAGMIFLEQFVHVYRWPQPRTIRRAAHEPAR